MPIYLGIDGGGTKTACAVGDDARILATATAGGSNVVRVGAARSRTALRTAITQACTAAGISPSAVTRTCIGVAGASVAATREAVRQAITEVASGEIVVAGDMEIATEAAFSGAPGAIVIAGTGSIAFGRNAAGETARAGGWGYVISDEGSGHWIGRRAISRMLRACDRGESSELSNRILRAWGLQSRTEIIKLANDPHPPDFSALLPHIVALSPSDAVARSVLIEAGSELAELADIVVRRLWRDGEWARIALAGGVFRHSPVVRHEFFRSLRARRSNIAINFAVVEPVQGALALARRSRAPVISVPL